MHPVLFHVGSIVVYSFGLLLAIGLIVAGIVILLFARKFRLPIRGLFDNLLFIMFLGVIGARLGYAVVYPDYFRPPTGSLMHLFALWQGGLLFYGALIGGLIAIFFVIRSDRRNSARWLDILMLGLLLGIAFGQMGCLLGGCAVGLSSGTRLTIDHRLPIQLYEALWSAAVFAVSVILVQKSATWRSGGRIFYFGALWYFCGRLLFDYWRPSTVSWGGISAAIWADLVFIIVLVAGFFIQAKRSRSTVEDSDTTS